MSFFAQHVCVRMFPLDFMSDLSPNRILLQWNFYRRFDSGWGIQKLRFVVIKRSLPLRQRRWWGRRKEHGKNVYVKNGGTRVVDIDIDFKPHHSIVEKFNWIMPSILTVDALLYESCLRLKTFSRDTLEKWQKVYVKISIGLQFYSRMMRSRSMNGRTEKNPIANEFRKIHEW